MSTVIGRPSWWMDMIGSAYYKLLIMPLGWVGESDSDSDSNAGKSLFYSHHHLSPLKEDLIQKYHSLCKIMGGLRFAPSREIV